jgi:hypothetical protein
VTRTRSPWVRAGALVLVVALVLGAGFTFASLFTGNSSSSSNDPTLQLDPTTTTTLSASQQTLADLLPDGPLDGMTRDDFDLGPLTVETAATEYPFGDADGTRMKTAGFVQGFSRGWEGADGRSAHVVVYEMNDAAGFMTAWLAAVKSIATGTFDTPVGQGLSDVEGTGEDQSEASIVAWVEGRYWYYVVHFGPADNTGAGHVRTIVAAVQAK